VSLILLATPVLAGLFLGAPMVATEFEAGTTQFGWMQGITRARWFAVKAGWLLLASAAWGAVIAALTTWWASPTNAEHGSEFYPGRFDVLYLVPVAYAVFAMALGICAGALIRRTVPAMAVTLGGFIAVRVAVTLWLRLHYLSAVTATRSLPAQTRLTGSYWLISQGTRNPAGQLMAGPQDQPAAFGVPISSLPKACAGLAKPTAGLTSSCRAALTGFRSFVTYQPASRFWPFQGIETGVFAVLAAILLAVTAVVLIRRDA
jgi:ABC-type transport system involved in multi-copper enzyme maturation permease subunit